MMIHERNHQEIREENQVKWVEKLAAKELDNRQNPAGQRGNKHEQDEESKFFHALGMRENTSKGNMFKRAGKGNASLPENQAQNDQPGQDGHNTEQDKLRADFPLSVQEKERGIAEGKEYPDFTREGREAHHQSRRRELRLLQNQPHAQSHQKIGKWFRGIKQYARRLTKIETDSQTKPGRELVLYQQPGDNFYRQNDRDDVHQQQHIRNKPALSKTERAHNQRIQNMLLSKRGVVHILIGLQWAASNLIIKLPIVSPRSRLIMVGPDRSQVHKIKRAILPGNCYDANEPDIEQGHNDRRSYYNTESVNG